VHAVRARQDALLGACLERFVDDGHLICRPEVLDPWLRTFDEGIARLGASRGRGPDLKSTVRLICPAGRENELSAEWCTEYFRSSCRVQSPNSAAEVLGVAVGDAEDMRKAAMDVCRKAQHESIDSHIEPCTQRAYPHPEMRRRVETAILAAMLWCVLLDGPAEVFNTDLRKAVEYCLGAVLPDTAWW
jgi:hypothetical protein